MRSLYTALVSSLCAPLLVSAATPDAYPVALGVYAGANGASVKISATKYAGIQRFDVTSPQVSGRPGDPNWGPALSHDRVSFFFATNPGIVFWPHSQFGAFDVFDDSRFDRRLQAIATHLIFLDTVLSTGVPARLLGTNAAPADDTRTNRMAGFVAKYHPRVGPFDPRDPDVKLAMKWVHGRMVRHLNDDVTLTFEHPAYRDATATPTSLREAFEKLRDDPRSAPGLFRTDRAERVFLRINPTTKELRVLEFSESIGDRNFSISCQKLLLAPTEAATERAAD